ncbi:AsmA family protein [Catalinimonas alkaloidigena]|uniref:AsmA family protein n=1 Tax=Catalinimonas alkaloidigena TaxID=1075417 RepID=A0A1G9DQK9_9BACT|nr:AsmA-like C-terminal region-containing protein [Catalinimonas alkaloidigena]SDK66144.1 AsmA family protein [Catalinimonas alkaloidigena]
MKKILYIVGGIVAFLLLAAALIPVLFKDQIKAQVDKALAESLKADVYYSADDFQLSLFRHFPNASVGLKNFGVVGRDQFAGDTLVNVGEFELVLNLMSLFGDQITVNSVVLDQPRILAKVLSDGSANWDIAVEDTTAVTTDTASSEFAIRIKEWNVNNGEVIYIDNQSAMYAHLMGLNHRGSGDISQDVYDLQTSTQVDYLTFEFDTVEYLSNDRLQADVTLNMNMPESKYTFKDNTIRLNDFAFGFDGFVQMPDTSAVGVDLTFQTRETDFKNILSLVPGIYTDQYDDLKTEGTLAFDGFAKGTYRYDGTSMPAFAINLNVNNGRLQYPDLPTPVENVKVDLKVNSPSNDLEEMQVNLNEFHLDMGKNPVDMKAQVKGLTNMNVDANVKANVNLAQVSEIFPLEGMSLRGLFNLNATAKGVYNDGLGRMPQIQADMKLSDGYVKTTDFPAPVENMAVEATVTNTTGETADTKVSVPQFAFALDGQPFRGTAYLENPDDLFYDVTAKGTINLTKIDQMFKLEEMMEMPGLKIAGEINADIETKGRMSDVEAERYGDLPTSGTMQVSNFTYADADLPQGVTIKNAALQFNPDRMEITEYQGALGKSDVSLTGYVSNYIGYLFGENQTIRGKMDFRSNQFDVNEWMSDEETSETDTAAVTEPFEVPQDVDFTLTTAIQKVLYDNMELTNVKGDVIVRDGTVRMQGLSFGTLGGTIVMNGTYDSRNLSMPSFDFDMDINQVSIPQAYQTFNTVQALAPVAKAMSGNFNTKFKLAGNLDSGMNPMYNTLDGGGLISLVGASVKDLGLLQKINSVTKLNAPTNVDLRDVKIQAEVEDGKAVFNPFDVKVGDFKMTIGGSNSFTGAIDYLTQVEVPAGKVGGAVTSTLSSLIGQEINAPEKLLMNFNVGGTYDDPKVSLAGVNGVGGSGTTTKEAVTEAVKEKVDDLKEQAQAKADSARKAAEARAQQELEKAKQEAEQKAQAEADRLKKEAEERAKKEAQKLKDRFGLPK